MPQTSQSGVVQNTRKGHAEMTSDQLAAFEQIDHHAKALRTDFDAAVSANADAYMIAQANEWLSFAVEKAKEAIVR